MKPQYVFIDMLSEDTSADRTSPSGNEGDDPSPVLDLVKECYFYSGADAASGVDSDEDIAPQLHMLTHCVLIFNNGFMVTGESMCADPANFCEEMGRDIAFSDAVAKAEPYLAFLNKQEAFKTLKDAELTSLMQQALKGLRK